jgi:CubicO group peptidase (beta-lactamase class C family)
VRGGYLVREHFTFNIAIPSRFDIWSGVKSFTATAYGILIEDSRHGEMKRPVEFDMPAYDFIPEGHPLTDPRKAGITFAHLLTMTSGIPGEKTGLIGLVAGPETGPFEVALGFAASRFGRSCQTLAAEPGAVWDYSDAAFAHLGLAFPHASGKEMHAFLDERLFRPIGIENLSWDVQGGSGFIGPHTNAHTGIHISARELARFAYLYLRRGLWADERLLPEWWIAQATSPSQSLNAHYGYAIWTNKEGTLWPTVPTDAFGFLGYRSNACYIVPSLDLIVVRIGTGPTAWDNRNFIGGIIDAIQE